MEIAKGLSQVSVYLNSNPKYSCSVDLVYIQKIWYKMYKHPAYLPWLSLPHPSPLETVEKKTMAALAQNVSGSPPTTLSPTFGDTILIDTIYHHLR